MEMLGVWIPPLTLVVGGTLLFLMLGFQTLVGLRKIKLGKRHLKYHRWIAYLMLVAVVPHAYLGLVFTGVLPAL